MTKALILIVAALVVSAGAGIGSQDPVEVAKGVYTVKLDNERVRVLEAVVKPGQRVPWHAHPDHVLYTIAGGTVKFSSPDGTSQVVKLKAGQTIYGPAEKHKAHNIGKTTARVLVIELK